MVAYSDITLFSGSVRIAGDTTRIEPLGGRRLGGHSFMSSVLGSSGPRSTLDRRSPSFDRSK